MSLTILSNIVSLNFFLLTIIVLVILCNSMRFAIDTHEKMRNFFAMFFGAVLLQIKRTMLCQKALNRNVVGGESIFEEEGKISIFLYVFVVHIMTSQYLNNLLLETLRDRLVRFLFFDDCRASI